MKIIIKNPAPLGPNQQKWGDYHFGRSLAKYLRRCGHQVVTHYYEEWCLPNQGDAVLVLRGKYRYRPFPGTVNVVWCMSNPSTITIEECNQFDAVCVASETHAAALYGRLAVPVFPLLQCTDLEEFESITSAEHRKGTVFVGNSRGVRRPCVDWAVEFGVDIAIYGRGWRDFGLQHRVVADYIANEKLPLLYQRSRLSLNDHWQDMKQMGYVNNRIFDCLAAGLPVISDDFPQLRNIVGDDILMYKDKRSMFEALAKCRDDYSTVLAKQQRLWSTISHSYSFESRAIFISDLMRNLQKTIVSKSVNTSMPRRRPFEAALVSEIHKLKAKTPAGYYCPVCGTHNVSFLPGGVEKKRPNAKCPTCGALERHRLVWMYMVNDLWPRLPRGKKHLLHVAPEEHLAKLLHESDDINYLSGDLFMPNVMVKLDLTDIDFPDNRFDIILCSHVLEHIPDDLRAMGEMLRVIKPGGFVIVIVPLYGETTYEDASITTPEGRLEHFGQDDHVRKYGSDIETRLSRSGFSVRSRKYATDLAPDISKFTALRGQVIYECVKPLAR